jgi:hypothetical protein
MSENSTGERQSTNSRGIRPFAETDRGGRRSGRCAQPDMSVIPGGVPAEWYSYVVPAASPRIQVTVDPELDAALSEFAGTSRSRTVRDLAVRGAEALREETRLRHDAQRLLQRIADGQDDRFDFSVSAELHGARR